MEVEKIDIAVNLLKIIKNPTSPKDYISNVKVSDIKISSKGDLSHQKNNKYAQTKLKLPKSKISVFVSKISYANKENLQIKNCSILLINQKIYSKFLLDAKSFAVNCSYLIEPDTNYGTFNFSAKYNCSDKLFLSGHSTGTFNIFAKTIHQNIILTQFSYKNFDFNDTKSSFDINENSCFVKADGEFGYFELKISSGIITAQAKCDLEKVSQDIKGTATANFENNNGYKKANLNTENLEIFGLGIDDINLYSEGNKSSWDFACAYGKGKNIVAKYFDKICLFSLILHEQNKGNVKINTEDGDIFANIKNVDLSDLPIASFNKKNITGLFSMFGAINNTKNKIIFRVDELKISNDNQKSIAGSIIRNKNSYNIAFSKTDGSISFSSTIAKAKLIAAYFKFNGIRILNALKILGFSKYNASGLANGVVKYKINENVEFDIYATQGSFGKNKFKHFKSKGVSDLTKLHIDTLKMIDTENKITADISGTLNLSQSNKNALLNIQINGFYIGPIKTKAKLQLESRSGNENKLKYVVKGEDISISNIYFGKLLSKASISPLAREIIFSDIEFSNGTSGAIELLLKKNKIKGSLNFNNANIEGFHKDALGLLNANISFDGSLTAPRAKAKLKIKNGRFRNKIFSIVSAFEYKDKMVSIYDAKVNIDKTEVNFQGYYSNISKISFDFKNLTSNTLKDIIDLDIGINGSFRGNGEIKKRTNEKPRTKLSFYSKNSNFKFLKFKSIESNAEISEDKILLSSTSLRVDKGEIKVNNAYFDFKSKQYNLDFSLANISLAGADLFGNIKSSGEIVKPDTSSKAKPHYEGFVKLNDLWINKYKLPKTNFSYKIDSKNLSFTNNFNKEVPFKCFGNIAFGKTLSFKEVTILKDKSFLNFNGDFSKADIKLKLTGNDVNLDIMDDIFDIPHIAGCKNRIEFNLSGPISKPEGKMSLTSSEGSFMFCPYDDMSIEVDFKNNYAYIKRFLISKKGETMAKMEGSFPFWVDTSLSQKMKKSPINVTYYFEDYLLSSLKYFLDGFVIKTSGKMIAKLEFKGSYSKIRTKGSLSISNGMLKTKNYFNKLTDISAKILVDENVVKIENISFKSGSGKVAIDGNIKLTNGVKIKDFDIRIATGIKGMYIYVPQLPLPSILGKFAILDNYSYGEPVFDIKIQGTPISPKISGWITLEKTNFTFPGTHNETESFLPENTEFDIKLQTGNNTKFDNSFISALINGSVSINGKPDDLKIRGDVEAFNGTIFYPGLEFNVVKARIEIVEKELIYVTADAETTIASQKKQNAENIKLEIERSQIPDLKIKFISKDNPALSSKEVLERLMGVDEKTQNTDQRKEEIALDADFVIKQQLARLVDKSILIPAVKKFLRSLSLVDNIRISYAQTHAKSTQTNSESESTSGNNYSNITNLLLGTVYTMEKSIFNSLFINYSILFDAYNYKLDLRHSIGVRYKLFNDLFLSGTYEFESENKKYEMDKRIMLQQSLRFGKPTTKKEQKDY
ncbi:MAG: translocation/assembly module TamB [Elusimicrobiota bacterium]|nr:translocation/assembly module TamB [Elusimicrobiota bacterium]